MGPCLQPLAMMLITVEEKRKARPGTEPGTCAFHVGRSTTVLSGRFVQESSTPTIDNSHAWTHWHLGKQGSMARGISAFKPETVRQTAHRRLYCRMGHKQASMATGSNRPASIALIMWTWYGHSRDERSPCKIPDSRINLAAATSKKWEKNRFLVGNISKTIWTFHFNFQTKCNFVQYNTFVLQYSDIVR